MKSLATDPTARAAAIYKGRPVSERAGRSGTAEVHKGLQIGRGHDAKAVRSSVDHAQEVAGGHRSMSLLELVWCCWLMAAALQ